MRSYDQHVQRENIRLPLVVVLVGWRNQVGPYLVQ